MKRLIVLISIIVLLALPASSFANHSAYAKDPANGYQYNNGSAYYPRFEFDTDASWSEFNSGTFELATDPTLDSNNNFYTEYSVVFKPFLAFGTTTYDVVATLTRGVYYWHYCVSAIDNVYGFHESCSEIKNMRVVEKVKVPSGTHKKLCKNIKYHTKHCKTSKNKKQAARNKKHHSKQCSKMVLK